MLEKHYARGLPSEDRHEVRKLAEAMGDESATDVR